MAEVPSEKKVEKMVSELASELSGFRKLSAQFKCIFNAIPDATVFADVDRSILLANPAVEKTFGYKPEEVIGQKTEIFYPSKEDFEEQGRIRFNLSAEDKLKPYKIYYRRKNGEIFLSETVGASVKDDEDNVIGFLGLMRDITDRKKRNDKLREAVKNYSTVADFTYDWEYWISPEGSLLYVSPSCERITGYTPTQFADDPDLLRNIILREDRDAWDNHFQDSHIDAGQREIQFRIKRSDGAVRWIEHACQPVIGSGGEYLGFRASNRDITGRKKGENDLRNALEEIKTLKRQLEAESSYLQEEINLEHNYQNIIGNSNALQYVLFKVEQIAASDTSIIILGETGTGKELIARAIHNTSNRSKRPLIKVNCAALPHDLIESELFGHEKGAFTGAHAKHVGRFEVADGASLFLDEIGELPIGLQA